MIPPDLVVRPSETVPRSPVVTRVQELPLSELTWENFERLCYRIVCLEADVEDCQRYGRPGQAQQGLDIYARRSDGRYDVWQCKRHSMIVPAELEGLVNRFLDGSWAARTECLTLAVSSSLQDTTLQQSLEAQAGRLLSHGIKFHALDQGRLSDRLKGLPGLVDDFFGRAWVVTACWAESGSP